MGDSETDAGRVDITLAEDDKNKKDNDKNQENVEGSSKDKKNDSKDKKNKDDTKKTDDKDKPPQQPSKIALFLSAVRAKLSSAAVKLESVTQLEKLRTVDQYGGKKNSPGERSTTIMGGILSFIFICIVLVVIFIDLARLIEQDRALSAGDIIHINSKDAIFKTNGAISVKGKSLDFPVLDLQLSNSLYFFESQAPSIQKIAMVDNTAYNPRWDSIKEDPPVTISAYSQLRVPFQDIKLPTTPTPATSVFSAVKFDTQQILANYLPKKFSTQTQALQLFDVKDIKRAYPHTTTMYVRIQENQLSQILPNQVDFYMYNDAEGAVWLNGTNTKWANFSTLTRAPEIYNFAENRVLSDAGFNVVELRNTFSTIVKSPYNGTITNSTTNSLMNWVFSGQYMSNFNYTLTSNVCEEGNNIYTIPITPVTYIKPVMLSWPPGDGVPPTTDNYGFDFTPTEKMYTPGVDLWAKMVNQTPFQLLLWNAENMAVTQVEYIIPDTGFGASYVDTNGPFYNYMQVYQTGCENPDRAYPFPHEPPSTWTCDKYKYFDLSCDCDCGALDPDCIMCSNWRYPLPWVNLNGTCRNSTPPDYGWEGVGRIAVGAPCKGKIYRRGDSYQAAFFGSAASMGKTSQCPGIGPTTIKKDADATIYCAATLQDNYRWMDEYGYFSSWAAVTTDFLKGKFTTELSLGSMAPTLIELDGWNAINRAFYPVSMASLPKRIYCAANHPFQLYGRADVLSALKAGDTSVVVKPLSNTTFIPVTGFPYELQVYHNDVERYFVTVTSATCPDEQGIQTLQVIPPVVTPVLDFWGTPAFATKTTGYSPYLETTLIVAATQFIILCRNMPAEIVVDKKDVHIVTSIYDFNTLANCCTTTCSGDVVLDLSAPISKSYATGTVVDRIFETQAYPYFTSTVLLNPNSRVSFDAGKRAVEFPVQPLDVEVGLHIVPQKSNYTALNNLCNATKSLRANSYDWEIDSRRYVSAKNCKLSQQPIDTSVLCSNFNCDTMKKAPPSNTFSFDQVFPVNEKWKTTPSEEDKASSPYTPEYTIDMSTVYYFDYSQDDIDAGRSFAAKMPLAGDKNQFGQTKLFTGELDFIGASNVNKSDPTAAEFGLYPANAPILNFKFVLKANKQATADFINSNGKNKVEGWKSVDLADKFPELVLDWPNIVPLEIQPGFNYTFTATVVMQPLNDVGVLGGADKTGWAVSSSTSFAQTSAGYANRNKAIVRFIVNFDKTVAAIDNRVLYSFIDFVSGVGSAIGLFGIGIIFLALWQQFTLPPSVINTTPAENIYLSDENSENTPKPKPEDENKPENEPEKPEEEKEKEKEPETKKEAKSEPSKSD